MSPDIRELDADTRDRIAAGEVVERPASVVKELLENALDADASRVGVAVEAGGTERIVVSDDGVGMSESEARKAVREHTTSKLRDIDDLESIGTLGFRGEALHAIGAVAHLEIRTKPRSGTRGTKLVVEGGEVVACGPVGCPEGTTVEVTDLFGNVPARRKYLKTDATEFAHVQQVVAGYALASPDVAVTLEHDGREAFSTTGDGDRRSAVMAVYGREVAASMIDVSADADAEGPLAGVEGLVSHPETNRAGSEYVTTLVNGRYVTASVVRDAVVDAYGTQLAPDRYPFAVLDVAVPPGGVDVNVHPRKLEVLFADDEGVREQVEDAVESALLEEGLLRTRAPRGRSAAEQTEIESDDGAETDADPQATESRHGARTTAQTDSGSATETEAPEQSDESRPAWREPTRSDAAENGAERADDARRDEAAADRKFRDAPAQRTLAGDETTGTPDGLDRLPAMDVLGQFDDTYVVAETDDGLVLVDQHAADERVNYERLREAFAGDVTTQALAEPVELELTAREATLVDDRGEALSRLGFRVQRPDERTVAVTTVPALVVERVGGDAPELARDLLSEFVDGDPTGTVEAVVDDLLGDLACHPSIKGNTSLREGSVAELLSALDGCENPYACPHGRPTVIELSRDEIAERFERDYPGHGGRRE
ncbi:DNA mismatch repair endonuclease MutL [Natronomonas salina]|uniref:DNA mismatch repair endonuclease MutL n=1 Tax=Natronomonas salina TaxID=1710540 RepID=UPI0015B49806|nr:DNA mismatch repair endonuclease MutL [Natronomonas salina]QLD89957.1 DNA mismatch repair endonuclease MutL [Natronomonas salina]